MGVTTNSPHDAASLIAEHVGDNSVQTNACTEGMLPQEGGDAWSKMMALLPPSQPHRCSRDMDAGLCRDLRGYHKFVEKRRQSESACESAFDAYLLALYDENEPSISDRLSDADTAWSGDEMDAETFARRARSGPVLQGAMEAVRSSVESWELPQTHAVKDVPSSGDAGAATATIPDCNWAVQGKRPTRTELPYQPKPSAHRVTVNVGVEADSYLLGAKTQLWNPRYRSTEAHLNVCARTNVDSADQVSTVAVKSKVVVDSGAAHTGVTFKWLKRYHPEALQWLDGSVKARFHSVTGDAMRTLGRVRLVFTIGQYDIEVWAHVFTTMQVDVLLGVNAFVEHGLVLNAKKCSLCVEGQVDACSEVQMQVTDDQLLLCVGGDEVATAGLRSTRTVQCRRPKRVRQTQELIDVYAYTDTTFPTSGGTLVDQPSGLPVEFGKSFTDIEQELYVEPSEEFLKLYPTLLTMDTVHRTGNVHSCLMMANAGTDLVHIPQGTKVGVARRYVAPVFLDDGETSVLDFDISLCKPDVPFTEGGEPRDYKDLLAMGLDVTKMWIEGRAATTQERDLMAAEWILHNRVIARDDRVPGMSYFMDIHIPTGDARPVASKPYSIPYKLQEAVKEEVSKLLRHGLISPCMSAWASPVLCVIKKDSMKEGKIKLKLATDLRRLNAVTEPDSGSIGDMQEIFDKFNGRPFATCMDISSGYYSFPIAKKDVKKLCFVLPFSMGGTTFCWNRAPYGVARLPSVFSRAINTILGGLEDEVSSFIDDITVHTASFERHLLLLRRTLRRLDTANLTIKASKTFVLPKELELLGCTMTAEGITTQEAKVQAISEVPAPSNATEVKSFLGAVQFYRRWVPHLATLAAPLTDLLKKNAPFVWAEAQECVFQEIKRILLSRTVMANPDLKDPNAEFWLMTDASDVGLAAILLQEQWDTKTQTYVPRTIGHYSKVLNPTQRRWAIYEKEACAMTCGIRNWRKYLFGNRFTVFTDSAVALSMMTKERVAPKLQRWGLLLQEYLPGMTVAFKRSEENGMADMLSRYPAFEKYVGSAKSVLELDDTLYDKLYEVPAGVRGSYGLYRPMEPAKFETFWNIDAACSTDERIAYLAHDVHVMALLDQRIPDGFSCYTQEIVQMPSRLVTSDNALLLLLEQTVCSISLDPIRGPVRGEEYERTVRQEEVAEHYDLYLQVFQRTFDRPFTIACWEPNSSLVAMGAHQAGCRVLANGHGDAMRFMRQMDGDVVSHYAPLTCLEELNSLPQVDGAFIRTAGDEGLEVASVLDARGRIPLQVEGEYGLLGTNISIEESGELFQQLSTQLIERGELSQLHHYAYDSSAEVIHGRVLAGQMAAVALRDRTGMPVFTRLQCTQSPSLGALVQDWAVTGYNSSKGNEDVEAELLLAGLETDEAGLEMPFIKHVHERFESLRAILTADSTVRVTIGGNVSGSLLGKGFAVQHWQQCGSGSYKKFMESLNTHISELEAEFPGQVSFGVVSGSAANLKHYQVWGANSSNWNLPNGSTICGNGMAAGMGIQKEGVFGVVTSPCTGIPLSSLPVEASSLQPDGEEVERVGPKTYLTEVTATDQATDSMLMHVKDMISRITVTTDAEAKRVGAAQKLFVMDAKGRVVHRSVAKDGTECLRVCIPWNRRKGLLLTYHTMPMYGHHGHKVLYDQLSKYYYWTGMWTDCVEFVQRCGVCATRRKVQPLVVPRTKATETPARPFHSLAIDIKGPLRVTDSGHQYILIVVDLLTGWLAATPLADCRGTTIARALVDNVFCIHGCCYSLRTDNATYFIKGTLPALADLYGIRTLKILPYSPTSNGAAEAGVKKVSNALARHTKALKNWDLILPLIVHGLNTKEHTSVGKSPFELLFGRQAVGPAELEWPELQRLDSGSGDEFVEGLAQNLRTLWDTAHEHAQLKKRQAASLVDQRVTVADVKPLMAGDWVYLEYGDDQHVKALGKHGMPRRRRFRVLEYYPQFGSVRLDTEGLQIEPTVSVRKISRANAPEHDSVVDTVQPGTQKAVEKRTQHDDPVVSSVPDSVPEPQRGISPPILTVPSPELTQPAFDTNGLQHPELMRTLPSQARGDGSSSAWALPSMPSGWRRESKQRLDGSKSDFKYYGPGGKVARSWVDMLRIIRLSEPSTSLLETATAPTTVRRMPIVAPPVEGDTPTSDNPTSSSSLGCSKCRFSPQGCALCRKPGFIRQLPSQQPPGVQIPTRIVPAALEPTVLPQIPARTVPAALDPTVLPGVAPPIVVPRVESIPDTRSSWEKWPELPSGRTRSKCVLASIQELETRPAFRQTVCQRTRQDREISILLDSTLGFNMYQ